MMTREELNRIYNEQNINNSAKFSNLENGYAILQTTLETNWKFRDYEEVVEIEGKEPTRADYNMLFITEFDKELYDRCRRREGYNEGLEEGQLKKSIEAARSFYANGASIELISKSLNMTVEQVKEIVNEKV